MGATRTMQYVDICNVIRANQSTGKDFQDTRRRVSGSGSHSSSAFKAFLLAKQVSLFFFFPSPVGESNTSSAPCAPSVQVPQRFHAFRGRSPADLGSDGRFFDLLLAFLSNGALPFSADLLAFAVASTELWLI